ncbi:hypothetical protein FRB99_003824 [Tulasnella sp. 403]|nr:hypothetical protein FRB99_003824 [Tulasnella sp. 403]
MVGRIIRLTFQTSALTATIAVINVILYMGLPGQAYHLLPQLIMGKIYVISVMVTLSARSELREIYENTGGATYMETRHGATTAAGGVTVSSKVDIASVQRPMHTGTTSLAPPSTGIQISTTTYVRDDNDNYIDPIQFDSDSKHRDIELGPVSKGPGKDDVEIPIQYPDGHIEGKKGGDDSSDSEADYSVSKLGNRFGANRV